MDINERLKQIEDLDLFLLEKDKLLSDVLSKLGWCEETLLEELKVQCPNDPGHWVPESSLPHHVEMCSWVKNGYIKEEKEKQPSSSRFFYQHAPSVISLTIDKETQANVLSEKGLMEKKPLDEIPDLPQTIDHWTVELTPEQRLAIYDYAVSEAKSSNKSKNVTLEDLMFDFERKDDQDGKIKTKMELLAEERNYKRRRQSYRAKNVHITKKSYTEVMKEVIENQITFLAETRKQEDSERLEDSSSIEVLTKYREHSPSHRESSRDGQNPDSTHHHSRKSRNESPPKKKRKHKHKRSRSRSRSRHHKKSRHKHKKSSHD